MNSSKDGVENDVKSFKILIVGDPDIATSFFSKNESNEMQPGTVTTLKAREINIQDMRFELWYCHELKDPKERDETFEEAEGVIALFAKGDRDSFGYIPHCITDVVKFAGKMLPTFVLGLSKENLLEQISKEDVLDYLYSLGNVSSCMIPYVELDKPTFQSVEEVLMDLVKIIECDKIDNCFTKPAILRGHCGLKQFEVKTS
ncbi:MAG: hypothetical protein GPJ54_11860 [Candidatus Heimdallarchaeota archaeon]|nr:hypothetical protein [Candidatus Heimdallarchaeota archaeon]